jgi:hypothetical protein
MASGTTDTPADTGKAPGLAATVALYAFARLGLVALIAVVLALAGVPLLLAILVALIVALPLSMVVFRGLRSRLDRALAVAAERRGAQRAALRAGLRGEGAESAGAESAGAGSAGPDSAGAPSDGEAQPEAEGRRD